MRMTSSERVQYEADGYFVRAGVFSPGELDELGAAAERAASLAAALSENGRTYLLDGKRFVDVDSLTVQFEHQPGSETIRVIEPVHELDPALDALFDDPRLAEPMRDLIGAEALAVWTSKLNLKRPREGSGFGWHQDSPYWTHDSNHVDKLPNVMLTLDDADEANGCFRVVRGSHKSGCLPGRSDGTQLGGFFTDPATCDEAAQVPMVAPAGSLIFFSPHSVHGSGPNGSARARRALVLTFQPGGFRTLKSRSLREVASASAAGTPAAPDAVSGATG